MLSGQLVTLAAVILAGNWNVKSPLYNTSTASE
jgi:hypothetical protein